MDLMECYLSTSRIVLQAKSIDPLTWQELHSLLPILHEHLSCQICQKLVDQLNPYLDGYACTVCVNHQITGNPSSAIVQCYKKLCAYIHSSPLYEVMCTRVEDKRLVELVTEVIGLPRSVNGYSGMVNGTVTNQEIKEKDSEDNITLMVNVTMNKQEIIEEDNKEDATKKNERSWGCRCGNAKTSGKLTCLGQRCLCYREQKPCDQCKCRGCRNPRQKGSNNDDNLEIDQIRRKP